ncbi:hypothetical protein LTR64_005064 [Lithohypha guttulata]|uniref:uncharacterized protein n=1 Tax=Lithohypha guttulata TaxID=1690604 RepID=UPI002DE087C8|nr:hypothetical protein LTR51_005101 [Lithohypha guttulata]
MPHTRTPPSTIEEILATATPDPGWTATLESCPIPSGADYELETLKQLSAASLPRLQNVLKANRPSDVNEIEVYIDIPSTELKPEAGRNRVIVTWPKDSIEHEEGWPVIVLFHGGGHSIGCPEQELPLARLLVQKSNAVVVLPSYRLAPEHAFPSSFNDAFETLKQVAVDAVVLTEAGPDCQAVKVLPKELAGKIDPKRGFVIGGTSAGATISASISHLYHKWRSSFPSLPTQNPPVITGIFFAAGTTLNPDCVPAAYQPYFYARKQNENALPLDKDLAALFHTGLNHDPNSPIWASLDQHPELNREKVGQDHLYLKEVGTRVYFQVCGQDISRDDGLIYERVLREEAGVETRLDLYSGFGHCFWGMPGPYTELQMSKRRMSDSVEGIEWLLRR